jgi:hypothetical protein
LVRKADESNGVTSKTIIIILAIALAGFKGTKLVLKAYEPPACHSDAAIKGLIFALRDSSLGTIAVNDAMTVSGGLLSDERDCAADIAGVRGGVDAADMHWMRVRYQVKKGANPDQADVTARLGSTVPLAPERSDFARWVEFFLD